MRLLELVLESQIDTAHEAGSKIPWNDPDFSRRMLENHLSQEHDWASRRMDVIRRHTAWVAGRLRQTPSRILDLGCGPGLYTQALAALGHHCVGVDFSPASITYARQQAEESGANIEYVLGDIREFQADRVFDCILMTFGEFNVFTRQDAVKLLNQCGRMLDAQGLFLLEVHTHEAVRAVGEAPAVWQRQPHGLFSEKPHLCLQENVWNAPDATAVSRYSIVDAETAEVRRYASFMQAYTTDEYRSMLQAAGLPPARILEPEAWPPGGDFGGKLMVFACRRD